MQKIMNNPQNAVEELLEGYVKCSSSCVERTKNPRVFIQKEKNKKRKVGVVSGGGTGHFPAFIGYLRPGILDAVAVGEIFKAPDAEIFLDAFREADMGEGVVCIQGNYKLDNKNVQDAVELAKKEGIRVERVVANDDVASMKDEDRSSSRGLAGEVLLWRVAGAAADMGYSLDDIVSLCKTAMDNTKSIGVGISACTIPEVGVPNFDVVEGTMEFGIGHHGDPGLVTYKLRTAEEIAELMLQEIMKNGDYVAGTEVLILLSGLGSTTQMELYILFNNIHDILIKKNIKICRSYVGNYFTSLDMGGASVTLLKLNEELKKIFICSEKSDLLCRF